jgi:hypothetical protein
MDRIVRAALAYFVAVFALGFVLGAVREGLVRPRFGTLGAIAIEAPAMLLACWWAARWVVGRFGVTAMGARWRMGALVQRFALRRQRATPPAGGIPQAMLCPG